MTVKSLKLGITKPDRDLFLQVSITTKFTYLKLIFLNYNPNG